MEKGYMQAGALPPEATSAGESMPTRWVSVQPAEAVIQSDGVVNAPIEWDQLIGGWLSDAPIFLVAVGTILAAWLQSDAPVTSRGILTIAVVAILAGLQAVQRATGSDGLSLRLRARGQIRGGK